MFEDFAVERLRVLRTLEKHNMGGKTKFSADWVNDIWRDLEKNGLLHYLKLGERQHGTEKVRILTCVGFLKPHYFRCKRRCISRTGESTTSPTLS